MLKEKKIPTILGLIILISGVFVGIFMTNKKTGFISKASNSCKPKNSQITNITSNAASISFITESTCLSSLSINNQTIENEAVVSVDQKSKIHYFDINNLNVDTEYNFSFIIDGTIYKESSYKFKTAINPSGPIPSSNLAWGRVFTPEIKAAKKVIIFVNIPGASPLSALATSLGNWNISLANSFNESKTGRFIPTLNTSEEIIVIDQENQTTQITGNTSNNDPTPDIILGQNQFSSSTVTYDTKTDIGSLSSITPVSDSKELDILNPKENESISTQKPDFFGTGPVNSTVKIEIHSPTVYNGEVIVNSDGSWNWSPPSDLEPGEHTIIAKVVINGIEKVVSKTFTVLATDGNLSYSASPSATTSIPTPTLTPTKTSTPTETPIILTPTLTSTPAEAPITSVSTSSSMPKTGNTTPTILLLLIASSFIVFSFFF
ncbi:MAG: Ig-like domain-containing protein [Candidatus Shapirobacteria bacterium]|nr:Ig-like domain-containing protein [Candidatus Shapirobacteria bacterium]MDD3002409.1 Ig-like domain-containing protein [Candidatus Shapirobacteria bacterium]MDD4383283.1 Ig-like domain-containing protein [Candidatus Shapirobacteria bacterium]